MIANEAIEDTVMESGEVSDSIEDWQKNIEKSASSFLDHLFV
ncbi:putative uroporphyrinogen IIIC-methyltransferase [Actinobacillus pleuropneumoniae]|nr:putative uroporphyrinogen IIIC-methyltransferase [Actinobacillus pleuropneumoniae]